MTYQSKNYEFPPGTLMFTSRVNSKVAEDTEFAKFVVNSLRRHTSCDWGDVCNEDSLANFNAISNGTRILSAYDHQIHPKIWIITEADRTCTTVLFPDEY